MPPQSISAATESEHVPDRNLGDPLRRPWVAVDPVAPAPTHSVVAEALLNRVIAAIALLISAPVMVLIAIAIRLTSPGPVLFRQTRVGLDVGTGPAHFTILKFRTMEAEVCTRERDGWATERDPRVTALGRVLRPLRLDELPQLINVLRGQMNVVGPRPERPHIFEWLSEEIPGFGARKHVKPGITGLAQIRQRAPEDIQSTRRKIENEREKLTHDLEYIRRKGVLLDLIIIAKTFGVMLSRRGGW